MVSAKVNHDFGWAKSELNYYAVIAEANICFEEHEIACVGAGLGGGFENKNLIHVFKYAEAMAYIEKKRQNAVDEEHQRMINNKVWKTVTK